MRSSETYNEFSTIRPTPGQFAAVPVQKPLPPKPAERPAAPPAAVAALPPSPPAAVKAAPPKAPPAPERPVPELGRLAGCSEEAQQLLANQKQLLPALYLLIGKSLYKDGLALLAHALARREAVYWACQCVRSTTQPDPETPAGAAVQSAEKWVADPTEENRRAAHGAAKQAGMGTPAGCVALAAFFSGGSLAPAELPTITPDPLLTPQMVANAILLAGVAQEPAKASERYHKYLTQGILLASGVTTVPGGPTKGERPVAPGQPGLPAGAGK
jgi:hypothetical protein